MRILTGINIAAVIMTLIVSMIGRAATPNLTAPRVGDRLSVHVLKNSPRWTDTLQLCPDCSALSVISTSHMRIWPPSQSDSVSYCVITTGSETVNIIREGDRFYQQNSITPGRTRIFDIMPEYNTASPVSGVSDMSTHGRTNNIGNFRTRGAWSTSDLKGLMLITTERDTLTDVRCVRCEMSDTLIYTDTDTTLYRGCVRQWFAPGYRYPLLTHEEGRLFSMNGDTLDHVNNWYATDLTEQQDNIKEDYINEAIRQSIRHRNPVKEAVGQRYTDVNGNDGVVSYDHSSQIITIKPSNPLYGYRYSAYVLCDISGVVHSCGDLPAEGTRISVSGYLPGTYIVFISTTNQPIIYKFTHGLI